jgi:hypothetical protein
MEAVRNRVVESDLQKRARRAEELARELRRASSGREAVDLSRELARISKEIERATRASKEAAEAG